MGVDTGVQGWIKATDRRYADSPSTAGVQGAEPQGPAAILPSTAPRETYLAENKEAAGRLSLPFQAANRKKY